MLQFKSFISENVEKFEKNRANPDHVENLPIDYGEHGYQHSLEALHNVNKKLQGKFNETRIKPTYDGGTPIVFGINPENNQFFVVSKSDFVSNTNLSYSPEDIENNYSDNSEIAEKLNIALEYLPKTAPKTGVYGGDYMYDQDSLVTHEGMHHFTPNKIQYSTDEKSDEGKNISKAKLGIVITTKYFGHSIKNMESDNDPDTYMFKKNTDVHLIPDEVGEVLHTGANQKAFEHHIKAVESTHAQAHPDTFKDVHPHAVDVKAYINHSLHIGVKPSIEGYRQNLMAQSQKAVSAAKGARAKQEAHMELLGKLQHVEDHSKQFESMFKINHHMQKSKNALVDSLANSNSYETSFNGNETKSDGFVAIHKGYPVKLADRTESDPPK